MITTVQNDMNIGDESPLTPLATVKLSLNRSYRKSGGLFRWAELEDAKKTSSVNGQEYYDYPDTWRPDSIWKLTVDGLDYGDPLHFPDFLFEKENNWPSGKTKAWANQWRRFFIHPIPTANGSNNICVWGQKNVEAMVNNGDVTIFSYSMPECNEALVLEAKAILKAKGEEQKLASEFISPEAKAILSRAWTVMKQEQAKYEKTKPFLDVPDMFVPGRNKPQNTGNFD